MSVVVVFLFFYFYGHRHTPSLRSNLEDLGLSTQQRTTTVCFKNNTCTMHHGQDWLAVGATLILTVRLMAGR